MEQVTLQAIKLKNLSRRNSRVNEERESSDGFMQIIDGMLQNMTDGDNFSIADVLAGKGKSDESENETDSNLLSMLMSIFQSGKAENFSDDILEMFKDLTGIESIDDIELPNIVSKLQQAGFLEAIGFEENTADTLYELGNNAYNYADTQFDVIKDFISEKIKSGDASESIKMSGVLNVGTMVDAKEADKAELAELPITSVSVEKNADDISVIQAVKGVSVPNMVSQRVVKADENVLANLLNETKPEEQNDNSDFNSQLNQIATGVLNQNVNVENTANELPKVQNLSNPLFNEYNIGEQITDGISANLNAEKTEFTVKLNPESLGELTLKVVEENGKMVVDIAAASESTAKLINGDLSALRESVASMNLEIREATVIPPESVQQNNAQFNMTSEQFSERQRAFHNQRQNDTSKPYYVNQDSISGDFEVNDIAGRVRSVTDGLDTYV